MARWNNHLIDSIRYFFDSIQQVINIHIRMLPIVKEYILIYLHPFYCLFKNSELSTLNL